MERIGKDKWSAHPNSVTSSFKLVLVDGLSSCTHAKSQVSGVCGLGWRFNLTGHGVRPDLTSSPVTQFDLKFDPHLIASAEFGTLSIIVTPWSLAPGTEGSLYSALIPRSDHVSLGSYTSQANFTGDATIEIKVTFLDSIGFSFPDEFPSQRVRKVLQGTLEGNQVIDTRFCLFARRAVGREPAFPKIIFASKVLLLGYSSYLDTLLGDSGFAESVQVDLGSNALGSMQDHGDADEYGYDSDSDLDSESDEDHNGDGVGDHTSREVESVGNLRFRPMASSSIEQSNEHQASGWEQEREYPVKGTSSSPVETKNMGQFIPIKDTALSTWKALIVYLYTRELNFKPLKSSKKPLKSNTNLVPLTICSPKSMYRLADKIGLPELQAIALQGIREHLTTDNIIEEVFTEFSSLYPAVLEVEVEFLMAQLTSTSGFFNQLSDKMGSLMQEGFPPHCSGATLSILHRLHTNSQATKPWEEALSPVSAVPSAMNNVLGLPVSEPARHSRGNGRRGGRIW